MRRVTRGVARGWRAVAPLLAFFIGPAFFLVLSFMPFAHGARPTLTYVEPNFLHCPAPSELIWNPTHQTAYCEPYNPAEDDFDR